MAARKKAPIPEGVAEIWSPIDVQRKSWDREWRDNPIVLDFDWSPNACAMLLALREVLESRVEVARAMADREPGFARHHQLARAAIDLIATCLTERPKRLVIAPQSFIELGILLYLDGAVTVLQEADSVHAAIVLRSMGWRPRYAPSAYQSPPGYRSTIVSPPSPYRPHWESPIVSGYGAPKHYSPIGVSNPRTTYESPDSRTIFHPPRQPSGDGGSTTPTPWKPRDGDGRTIFHTPTGERRR